MSSVPRRFRISSLFLYFLVSAFALPVLAADRKADTDDAIAKANEAAAQAKEAAAQATEAARQIKELGAQLEQAIKLAKDAAALANDAAAKAKEVTAVLDARDAKEREKEAKIEAARQALEAELKEALAEDAAEKKLQSERAITFFEGRITLYGPEKERSSPDIVGEFEHAGKTYLLKLGSPDVIRELQALDGKPATLNGKIRNQGKYFIAAGIVQGGMAPAATRRRGGI